MPASTMAGSGSSRRWSSLEELSRRQFTLPFHLELIAFAEEEGVRFGTAYLGSSVIAGRFEPRAAERAAMHRARPSPTSSRRPAAIPPTFPTLARRPGDLLGYLEVHIEQGPVLLEAGLPLGIVTAIAGGARYAVSITGVAGHAGTVPMAVAARCGGRRRRNRPVSWRRCAGVRPGWSAPSGRSTCRTARSMSFRGAANCRSTSAPTMKASSRGAIADVQARIAQIEQSPRRHHQAHRAAAGAGRAMLACAADAACADVLEKAATFPFVICRAGPGTMP